MVYFQLSKTVKNHLALLILVITGCKENNFVPKLIENKLPLLSYQKGFYRN